MIAFLCQKYRFRHQSHIQEVVTNQHLLACCRAVCSLVVIEYWIV